MAWDISALCELEGYDTKHKDNVFTSNARIIQLCHLNWVQQWHNDVISDGLTELSELSTDLYRPAQLQVYSHWYFVITKEALTENTILYWSENTEREKHESCKPGEDKNELRF